MVILSVLHYSTCGERAQLLIFSYTSAKGTRQMAITATLEYKMS